MELFRGDSLHLCPVLAMEQFLGVWPAVDGALFVHSDGSFLSKFQFNSVFRKCLKGAGLFPGDYSSYFFLIGAATEVSWWVLTDGAIKWIGRLESKR